MWWTDKRYSQKSIDAYWCAGVDFQTFNVHLENWGNDPKLDLRFCFFKTGGKKNKDLTGPNLVTSSNHLLKSLMWCCQIWCYALNFKWCFNIHTLHINWWHDSVPTLIWWWMRCEWVDNSCFNFCWRHEFNVELDDKESPSCWWWMTGSVVYESSQQNTTDVLAVW